MVKEEQSPNSAFDGALTKSRPDLKAENLGFNPAEKGKRRFRDAFYLTVDRIRVDAEVLFVHRDYADEARDLLTTVPTLKRLVTIGGADGPESLAAFLGDADDADPPVAVDPDDPAAILPTAAFSMTRGGPALTSAPPRLGQNSRETLAALGYDTARIAELFDSGVVR